MKDAIFERPKWHNRIALVALCFVMFLGFVWGFKASAQELSPSVVLTEHADTMPVDPANRPILTKQVRARLPPTPTQEWKVAFGQTVISAARMNGIPPNLVMAVIAVESGFNPNARNGTSSGLMQIKPPTAQSVGFEHGSLFDPVTNIRVATNYLAIAYKMVNGNICATVSKYNRGLGSNATSHDYCAKVARIMEYAEFQIE